MTVNYLAWCICVYRARKLIQSLLLHQNCHCNHSCVQCVVNHSGLKMYAVFVTPLPLSEMPCNVLIVFGSGTDSMSLLIFLLLFLLGRPSSKIPKAPLFQIGIGMKFAELFRK